MQSEPRNVSLLQVTYDQANQQWVLHIGDSNSVSVVRDNCHPVDAEDTLRISDFGGPSSAVLELSFPCGEVIRQEFAPRDGSAQHREYRALPEISVGSVVLAD